MLVLELLIALLLQLGAVGADLTCYIETAYCKSASVVIPNKGALRSAAEQCCVYNGGRSYRMSSTAEGCTPCVVYGFSSTATDIKLLTNVTVGETRLDVTTLYIGVMKGSLSTIRRLQLKASFIKGSRGLNVKSSNPFMISPQNLRYPVTMYAESDNVTLEDNSIIKIEPISASMGGNEFLVPLTVTVVDTDVMKLRFGAKKYYVKEDASEAIVTLIRENAIPARPLKCNLYFLPISDIQLLGRVPKAQNAFGSTSVVVPPTNQSEFNVSVPIKNGRPENFAVTIEIDDDNLASFVDLTNGSVAFVETFDTVVGFTESHLNVTAKESFEICVNVTRFPPTMDYVELQITSDGTGKRAQYNIQFNRQSSLACVNSTIASGTQVSYKLSLMNSGRHPNIDIFPNILNVIVVDVHDT